MATRAKSSFATRRLLVLTAILVAASLLLVSKRTTYLRPGKPQLRDSLLVEERSGRLEPYVSVVTGPLADAAASLGQVSRARGPAWVQAIQLPWLNATLSPDERLVAVERMTPSGTDVFVLTKDTVDRVPIAVGGGVNIFLGWAPDGSRLLVRRPRIVGNGAFDSDLWAYAVDSSLHVRALPVDTSAQWSVREARWSPDGARIAWVAQAATTRQQDIFVAHADGGSARNVTASSTDEYHISWSPDGNLLAFTRDSAGNPDLFALEFEQSPPRLWALTRTPFNEDRASFSPDGRFLAFQSTREADAAIYVMPALGGSQTRVTPPGRQFSIAGWRGGAGQAYVDRLRIIGASGLRLRDSMEVSLLAVDALGRNRSLDSIDFRVIDTGVVSLRPVRTGENSGPRYRVAAVRPGIARLVASIPGWRADTLAIRVGSTQTLIEDFDTAISSERWLALGDPLPRIASIGGKPALVPSGDLQWQSGVLSREAFPMTGIDLSAVLLAPFRGRSRPAALLVMALVGEVREGSIDRAAPQLESLVAVAWDGEAGRLVYSVGQESRADPVELLGPGPSHVVRFVIDPAGGVVFFVDGKRRWDSSLRFLGSAPDRNAKLWLGGRASGDSAAIRNLRLIRP